MNKKTKGLTEGIFEIKSKLFAVGMDQERFKEQQQRKAQNVI